MNKQNSSHPSRWDRGRFGVYALHSSVIRAPIMNTNAFESEGSYCNNYRGGGPPSRTPVLQPLDPLGKRRGGAGGTFQPCDPSLSTSLSGSDFTAPDQSVRPAPRCGPASSQAHAPRTCPCTRTLGVLY